MFSGSCISLDSISGSIVGSAIDLPGSEVEKCGLRLLRTEIGIGGETANIRKVMLIPCNVRGGDSHFDSFGRGSFGTRACEEATKWMI